MKIVVVVGFIFVAFELVIGLLLIFSPVSMPEDPVLRVATLNVLVDKGGISQSLNFLSKPEEIAAQRDRLEKLRIWANALPQSPAKSRYLSWLDYFDNKTTEAEVEGQQWRAKSALASTLPQPEEPK